MELKTTANRQMRPILFHQCNQKCRIRQPAKLTALLQARVSTLALVCLSPPRRCRPPVFSGDSEQSKEPHRNNNNKQPNNSTPRI
jgi:hypothetical protein